MTYPNTFGSTSPSISSRSCRPQSAESYRPSPSRTASRPSRGAETHFARRKNRRTTGNEKPRTELFGDLRSLVLRAGVDDHDFVDPRLDAGQAWSQGTG